MSDAFIEKAIKTNRDMIASHRKWLALLDENPRYCELYMQRHAAHPSLYHIAAIERCEAEIARLSQLLIEMAGP